MVIPFIVGYYITVDGLFRTPSITGEAILAVMLPNRSVFNHFNIIYRTNSGTDSAAIAFFVILEASVR
jgi:hypothetical protein